jgi:Flp pilus assembly protein TadD/outer membrane protein OmpA-like peptidoglycan-associated protein
MRRKNYFFQTIVIILIAAFMSSCGLGKMVKKYPEVKFQATPDVLENQGGKVPVSIKGEIPPKYFKKKATLVYQPVIKYNGGTKELKPITLKGEKVLGDGITINKKTGGSFTYTDSFDFLPDMTSSTLEVVPVGFIAKEEVKQGMKASEAKGVKNAVVFPSRKFGDGVINTCSKIYHDEDVVVANQQTVTKYIKGTEKDFYEKETIMTNKGKLFFIVNQSDLAPNYKLNKDPEAKKALDSLSKFLKMEWRIKNFAIDAWASPEGEESRNQGLSERRSKTGNEYMVDFFKKYKKEKAKLLKKKEKEIEMQEITYAPASHGEDWDGFMQAVGASDIKDKNTILNVVKSQADHALREQEIRNMTVIYKEIEENILPPLRRAEFTVQTYLPKKTDEQIARLSTSYPDSLDVKELLYAAGLTSDINTQQKIYKSLTTLYPADWKGFNNLGFVGLTQGNLEDATTNLGKANTLSPSNPIVLNNLGALAAKKGDFAGAKNYYKNASDLGVNVDYNKGILTILDGDYKTAANLMSAKKCNYNNALVQVLTGNSTEALNTLGCAPDNAEKYYLMAVAGARTKNQALVIDNLKKAVKEKPSLKAVAKEDREFIKFFDNAEFQGLVK